jgi:hypothetical protein
MSLIIAMVGHYGQYNGAGPAVVATFFLALAAGLVLWLQSKLKRRFAPAIVGLLTFALWLTLPLLLLVLAATFGWNF